MMEENEEPLQKLFLAAIYEGNLEDVKTILNKGININYKHTYFDTYQKTTVSETTFEKVVCSDSPHILDYLFTQGLIVDNEEKSKDTLIFIHNKECLKIAM